MALVSYDQYQLYQADWLAVDTTAAGVLSAEHVLQLIVKQIGRSLPTAHAHALLNLMPPDTNGNYTLSGYLDLLLGVGWKVDWSAQVSSIREEQSNTMLKQKDSADFVTFRASDLLHICSQLNKQQVSPAGAAAALCNHQLVDEQYMDDAWLRERSIEVVRNLPPEEVVRLAPQLLKQLKHSNKRVRTFILQTLSEVDADQLQIPQADKAVLLLSRLGNLCTAEFSVLQGLMSHLTQDDEEVISQLLRKLDADDPDIRMLVLQLLEQSQKPDQVESHCSPSSPTSPTHRRSSTRSKASVASAAVRKKRRSTVIAMRNVVAALVSRM